MRGNPVVDMTRLHESAAANTFRITDNPPVFVSGSGAVLKTDAGEEFLDFVAGSSTAALGYGHPAHHAALARAASSGIFHTGTRLPSPFRVGLYRDLSKILPNGLDCFQLVNSGAEAVEASHQGCTVCDWAPWSHLFRRWLPWSHAWGTVSHVGKTHPRSLFSAQ